MADRDSAVGSLSGLPVWTRVVMVLGFPSFIATMLLMALLGYIRSPMTDMLDILKMQSKILSDHDEISKQQRRMIEIQMQYQNVLMRSICRGIVPSQNQAQCEPKYYGYEEPEYGRK